MVSSLTSRIGRHKFGSTCEVGCIKEAAKPADTSSRGKIGDRYCEVLNYDQQRTNRRRSQSQVDRDERPHNYRGWLFHLSNPFVTPMDHSQCASQEAMPVVRACGFGALFRVILADIRIRPDKQIRCRCCPALCTHTARCVLRCGEVVHGGNAISLGCLAKITLILTVLCLSTALTLSELANAV